MYYSNCLIYYNDKILSNFYFSTEEPFELLAPNTRKDEPICAVTEYYPYPMTQVGSINFFSIRLHTLEFS